MENVAKYDTNKYLSKFACTYIMARVNVPFSIFHLNTLSIFTFNSRKSVSFFKVLISPGHTKRFHVGFHVGFHVHFT